VPSPLKEELNEDESDEETTNRTPKSRSNNIQGSKGSTKNTTSARSLSKEALPPKSPKIERKR